HFLGHDFRFVTSVFADSLTPGNLYGNLYIKGYGDPNLTGFDLDSLA
ncbi:MAG TPA: D-alanyl-D-alanine carboxypeptidase, partial [Bacteroidota bacterium]